MHALALMQTSRTVLDKTKVVSRYMGFAQPRSRVLAWLFTGLARRLCVLFAIRPLFSLFPLPPFSQLASHPGPGPGLESLFLGLPQVKEARREKTCIACVCGKQRLPFPEAVGCLLHCLLLLLWCALPPRQIVLVAARDRMSFGSILQLDFGKHSVVLTYIPTLLALPPGH